MTGDTSETGSMSPLIANFASELWHVSLDVLQISIVAMYPE